MVLENAQIPGGRMRLDFLSKCCFDRSIHMFLDKYATLNVNKIGSTLNGACLNIVLLKEPCVQRFGDSRGQSGGDPGAIQG